MLSSHLQQVVADYDRQQLQAGSPLGMKLNDAGVIIGPDGRDVIQLSWKVRCPLNTMLASFPMRLKLSLEALPVYVKEERPSIFVDSNYSTAVWILPLNGLNLDQSAAAKQGVSILAQLLEHVPVYRLNEKNMAEAIVASSPLVMKVTRGRLVFALEGDKLKRAEMGVLVTTHWEG